MDILKLPDFQSATTSWKYNKLHSNTEIIEELIKESTSSDPDISKMAFLKELGRAAYQSPLVGSHINNKVKGFLAIGNNKEIRRAQRIAELEASQEYSKVTNCPVCGVRALIIYHDTDYYIETDKNGKKIEQVINCPYMLKCECCSFNLEGGIRNASEYQLANIENFW